MRQVLSGRLHVQLLAVLGPAFAALDQGRKLRIREHDLGRVEAPAPKRAVMLDQLFLRDAAPFEDLQHLLVAVMQQPWTDTRLAVRSDEVDGPIPRGNVDQDTVHRPIVAFLDIAMQLCAIEQCALELPSTMLVTGIHHRLGVNSSHELPARRDARGPKGQRSIPGCNLQGQPGFFMPHQIAETWHHAPRLLWDDKTGVPWRNP